MTSVRQRVPKPVQIGPWDWELQEEDNFMPIKYLTQCLLFSDDNVSVLVSWVPKEFAKVGKRVKINDKGVDGIFTVKDVYLSSTMDEKSVIENSQDYRRTRKFSDI
jgi:hypothetical protein